MRYLLREEERFLPIIIVIIAVTKELFLNGYHTEQMAGDLKYCQGRT